MNMVLSKALVAFGIGLIISTSVPAQSADRGDRATTFWFMYTPDPGGKRTWVKLNGAFWKEIYPDGRITNFVEIGDSVVNGCPGVITKRVDAPEFQVFIPHAGCARSLWSRWPTEWGFLGEIGGVWY